MKRHSWLLMILLGFGTGAYAQSVSHNYVNTTRSSFKSHIFVSQSIEGEYGDFSSDSPEGDTKNVSASTGVKKTKWQGYNTTTTLGVEVMKFIQFDIFHSSMNMRSAKTSLEHLGGSRFGGGARLVFLAPLANLELGGGVLATRYDYQKDLETSDFYGSGFYYSIGMNYFISEKVSFFGTAKMISEHSVRSGGSSTTETITANMTNLGLGFSLWL